MSDGIDVYRKRHLAIAEFIDAWRLIPRSLVAGYAYMLAKVVWWYMSLEPHLPKDILHKVDQLTPEQIKLLLVEAPTTQHAVLVSTVVGIGAAIFGLYSSSGKRWNEGFHYWGKDESSSSAKE
jgi:hypothetical protein